ncbi:MULTISPECIES: hypothetical protein [Sphingobacterium]|uniref:Uncharacterized protein n=1 Tax=Sphingobacterium multivorum TaxID=28454 RepID=A0A2X2JIU9_SPHMU|nr:MULTISPECIES: hypothetical protein [Sphingobacterium]QRQ60024.1 hypothetical protein I6J33_17945 [Sphingobacterium multivorum]SPZ92106.1 Uncharacterised protein [Sphingobacterium multivorum]
MNTPKIDLSSLNIEQDFLDRSNILGMNTLEDIMNVNLPELRKDKNFNYIWYSDLLLLLERAGLLDEFEKRKL